MFVGEVFNCYESYFDVIGSYSFIEAVYFCLTKMPSCPVSEFVIFFFSSYCLLDFVGVGSFKARLLSFDEVFYKFTAISSFCECFKGFLT